MGIDTSGLLMKLVLLMGSRFVEFRCQRFGGGAAQSRFQQAAGRPTLRTGKALGFQPGLTLRRDDDFDNLHEPSPT